MSWKFNPFTEEFDYYEDGSEAFPIGGIYLNVTGVNPATELGYGTWTQVAQGQILVGEA